MKLDKAIEILTIYKAGEEDTYSDDLDDALQLGIEALKVIKRYRSFVAVDAIRLLPGETP